MKEFFLTAVIIVAIGLLGVGLITQIPRTYDQDAIIPKDKNERKR